jgi:hypothetical protein
MRSLRGVVVALGSALVAFGLGGFAATGCGNSGNGGGGGGDSSADTTSDSTNETESGADTSMPDAGADVVVVDSGTTPDTGVVVDSGVIDSGVVDTGADSGQAEAGLSALGFADAYGVTYCRALFACCPSGVSYDVNACSVAAANEGWELSLPSSTLYSRGHIVINDSQAAACLAAVANYPCGTQTAAQAQAVTNACELVLQGTIPIGSAGCLSSFECAPGAYCDPTTAGGTCTALATLGQPCDTKINSTTPVIPDQMCSYLGSANTGLFCDIIDNGPDAGTCQHQLAAGANCANAVTGYYDDLACAPPSLCSDNNICGGTTSYPYPFFCNLYAIHDAGTD